MNGDKCLWGKYCWFKHDEKEISEKSEIKNFEKSEVGQKILNFMEEISVKLNKLEQNNLT